MTKVEAIEKVLSDNGGMAGWGIIYKQIELYYPIIKNSSDWKAGVRGVLYRDIRNGRRFKMVEEGVIALRDYDEQNLALAADLHGPTQITVLASIRRGQQRFRDQLLKTLEGKCPITGLADKRLLISSHIKPWAVSTDTERLDVNNGFLFSPTVDKLFDKGFISFSTNKHLLISSELSKHSRSVLNLQAGTCYHALPLKHREHYLEYHRENIFSE
jgi:putative restriction endonuclease